MAEVVRRRFQVSGMTCGGCVRTVQRVVSALPGVKGVQVSLGDGVADVDFDPSQLAPEAIATALDDAGYEAAPT